MSTYSSDYQRILKELREMRKRLARREQSDLKRFKDSNPDSTSAIQRDHKTALDRQQKESDKFRQSTGQQPKKVSYPVQRGSATPPRQTKYPTAAEIRAAAQRGSGSSSGSGSSGSSSSSSGSSSQRTRATPAEKKPDPRKGLRSNFDGMGRLGKALAATQDAILDQRGIKKGKSDLEYSVENATDYSKQAAKASRSKRKPDVDTDQYLGLTAPDYSQKAAKAKRKKKK